MVELDLGKVVMDSYNDLDNKPKINGVELNGELKTSQFGLDQAIEAVNLARLNFKEFNTLEEFVNETAKENDVPHFSTMWDGGGWGPLKRATHYKYLIAYEGRYNNPGSDGVIRDDVKGSGLFWDNENNIWYVTIQGNVGTLTFSYFKIEPNQIPTNNLLATVAGTPLDAVQGKVLKGQIGDYTLSPSVIDSNTSYGIRTIFGTISNNSGTDSITQHFKDIGFSSTDKTFQELLELICQGSSRREFIKIGLNSNTTIFNKSLPMTSAGVLEIYRMEQRRCVIKLNYLKGGEYVNSYTDGTLGAWEKVVTETEFEMQAVNPTFHSGITVTTNYCYRNKCSCTIHLTFTVDQDINAFTTIISILPKMTLGGFNFVAYTDAEQITPSYKFLLHSQGFIQPRKKLTAGSTVDLAVTYACI